MSALILVVDDRPTNVLLLETKLSNEYYNVITARDGFEAIQKAKDANPDLILLDVMMPGIDGFEVCKRLKGDMETAHIPIILVTALSSKSDRLRGLEAGAEDFLTKPFNDIVFFARAKSLIRIKQLMDELKLRDKSISTIGTQGFSSVALHQTIADARVLLVDDDTEYVRMLEQKLNDLFKADRVENADAAMAKLKTEIFDVVLINADLETSEGLRLAKWVKSSEWTRHLPIIIKVEESKSQSMLKALEMGVNDYLLLPVDANEMMARVKTQIRRKRYQDMLLASRESHNEEYVFDSQTGLFNRRFFDAHLIHHIQQSQKSGKPFTVLFMDIDEFRVVNETHGMDAGNYVLQQVAEVVNASIRGSDVAARFGGEEFAVLLPDTDGISAMVVMERLRRSIGEAAFSAEASKDNRVTLTVSIGGTQWKRPDTPSDMVKRVDEAVYRAKQVGRNQVQMV